jgi:hypothetical protein
MVATIYGDQWNTSPSSSKTFTFVCTVCGEPSKSRMATKVRANDEGREHRACIYCGAPVNSKYKKKPESISKKLRAELVPDSKLTPVSHVVTGMSEIRLWDCSNCTDGRGKPYRFVASVAVRTGSFNPDAVISKYNLPPQGCPQCVESISLFAADSETEFDQYHEMLFQGRRNLGYTALSIDDFPLWHKAFFKCELDHVRYCSLNEMADRNGCLTCFTALHKGKNLADDLYKELHPEFVSVPKYPTYRMQDVPSGSSIYAVLWRCKKDSAHEWLAYPFRRTRDKRGCPFCAGRRIAVGKSLADKYPEIAAEFEGAENNSPRTNKPISTASIRPDDMRFFNFRCSGGHLYRMSMKQRTSGSGCPECIVSSRSLASARPELAREWHVERNKKLFPALNPAKVTIGSKRNVWWRCTKNPAHEWIATVQDRVQREMTCRYCRQEAKQSFIADYSEVAAHFDEEATGMSASLAPAKKKQVYKWLCTCGKVFDRRFADVLNRGITCGHH